MAAITPTATRTPEGNLSEPLSDKRMFRFTLQMGSQSDTFVPGFPVNSIAAWAVAPTGNETTTAASQTILVSLTASTNSFSFISSGTTANFDLLVWVNH